MQSKCEGGGFEYRNIVICMLVQNTVSDHSGEKKKTMKLKLKVEEHLFVFFRVGLE